MWIASNVLINIVGKEAATTLFNQDVIAWIYPIGGIEWVNYIVSRRGDFATQSAS
jgi:hypothetical protein